MGPRPSATCHRRQFHAAVLSRTARMGRRTDGGTRRTRLPRLRDRRSFASGSSGALGQRRGWSAVEDADGAVGVGESGFAVGRVDCWPVIVEPESLGDFARGGVVLGNPRDDRNVGVDGRRGGLSRATEFGRVAVALVRSRDAVVEIPGPGSLPLGTADAEDLAVVAPTYRPIAELIGCKARHRAGEPVLG